MEDSLEFQKALNEACEKQYRGYLYGGGYARVGSKDDIADKMEQMQEQRRKLEEKDPEFREHAEWIRQELRLNSSPQMREITANLKRKGGASGLICPVCGEGDHGNRMNGKPACLMNWKHKAKGVDGPVPLMTPEKAKEWKPPKKPVKRGSYMFNEVEGVTRKRRR